MYTTIIDGYDKLPEMIKVPGVKYVCFSDTPFKHDLWKYKSLPKQFSDHRQPERMANRYVKIMGHVQFDEDITLYIDANVSLDVKKLRSMTQDPGMYATKHARRRCLYDEAKVVLEKGLDESRYVLPQIKRYRQEGLRPGIGLSNGYILLRHSTLKVKVFTKLWWKEVEFNSIRDQISMPYAAWKTDLIIKNLTIPHTRRKHLKKRVLCRIQNK